MGKSQTCIDRMLSDQGNCCVICGAEFFHNWCADIDDGTGELRGLVCKKCSFILDIFHHNPYIFYEAYEYCLK